MRWRLTLSGSLLSSAGGGGGGGGGRGSLSLSPKVRSTAGSEMLGRQQDIRLRDAGDFYRHGLAGLTHSSPTHPGIALPHPHELPINHTHTHTHAHGLRPLPEPGETDAASLCAAAQSYWVCCNRSSWHLARLASTLALQLLKMTPHAPTPQPTNYPTAPPSLAALTQSLGAFCSVSFRCNDVKRRFVSDGDLVCLQLCS